MNFYLLFMVFLYVGGCNSRVVPLNFKLDKSKPVGSSITGNELSEEFHTDEVEILGHNLPDIGHGKGLELLNSEDNKIDDISNRNGRNQSADLIPKEKVMDEGSSLDSESSAMSDLLEEKLNSTSEFMSQNNSVSRDSFQAVRVNESLNKMAEELNFKNETSITNNSSSLDLEQQNNLDLVKVEEKVLNNTLDESDDSEIFKSEQNEDFSTFEVNSDQNETFALFQINYQNETFASFQVNYQNETFPSFQVNEQNETFASFEDNRDQNEIFASFEVNSDQNETFASFEVNSDQNETFASFEVVNDTNSTNFIESQPMSNDTKVEFFLSNIEDVTEKSIANNFTSETLELTNDSIKTAGGIFSGFEFLINSEVARNAAKAMEVFNFSDSLTDHIMEENEFHSFLAVQNLDSPNQTDLKTTTIISSSSAESNEIRADLNASFPSVDETSVGIDQLESEEIGKDSSMPFNPSEPLEERNKTQLFDLEEKFEGNVASEVSSPLENSEKIQSASEATILKENIKESVTNSSAVNVSKCPPPGWCVFWFLSQDACAVSEHCHGNRICCKIGCSKTCIEVESQ